MNRKIVTPERIALMHQLWSQMITNAQIAAQLDVSIPTMIKWGKAAGLPSRMGMRDKLRVKRHAEHFAYRNRLISMPLTNVSVVLTTKEAACFRTAAKQRGITTEDLCLRILRTVVNDNMISAVLDDADEITASEAQCPAS